MIASGIFGLSQATANLRQQDLLEAREFFEMTVVFYSLAHDFKRAEEKFHMLTYFYDNFRHMLPQSNIEANIVALRLIYLYVTGNNADYFSFLESLPVNLRTSSQVKTVEQFANFVDMGNYNLAFDCAGSISAVHKQVLGQLQETQKRE